MRTMISPDHQRPLLSCTHPCSPSRQLVQLNAGLSLMPSPSFTLRRAAGEQHAIPKTLSLHLSHAAHYRSKDCCNGSSSQYQNSNLENVHASSYRMLEASVPWYATAEGVRRVRLGQRACIRLEASEELDSTQTARLSRLRLPICLGPGPVQRWIAA